MAPPPFRVAEIIADALSLARTVDRFAHGQPITLTVEDLRPRLASCGNAAHAWIRKHANAAERLAERRAEGRAPDIIVVACACGRAGELVETLADLPPNHVLVPECCNQPYPRITRQPAAGV